MTLSTSAVAVCCSRASRVSVISRAFSIAMTACAAKFCNSAICLSENGRSFVFINYPSFTDFVLANGSYCSGVSYSVAERTDER